MIFPADHLAATSKWNLTATKLQNKNPKQQLE